MESTVSRMASILGATALEEAGSDTRFAVHGPEGAVLKVSLEAKEQRLMGVLVDGAGVTRATVDLAPVGRVTETPDFPGRVTVHVGNQHVHIDSQPTLAIEVFND